MQQVLEWVIQVQPCLSSWTTYNPGRNWISFGWYKESPPSRPTEPRSSIRPAWWRSYGRCTIYWRPHSHKWGYCRLFDGVLWSQMYGKIYENPTLVTNRPVVDGDLEPQTSRYTLTPLKLVYKKLRLLVDQGCIFIGHGLSKDFRIISKLFCPLWYLKVYHFGRHLRTTRTSDRHCRSIFSQSPTATPLLEVFIVVCLAWKHSDWYARFYRGCSVRPYALQSLLRVRGARNLRPKAWRTL